MDALKAVGVGDGSAVGSGVGGSGEGSGAAVGAGVGETGASTSSATGAGETSGSPPGVEHAPTTSEHSAIAASRSIPAITTL